MQTLLKQLSRFFENLPDKLRRRKGIVWVLFLVFTAVIGSGITQIRTDLSTESFFSESDPIKQAYNDLRSTFGSDETIFIVYRAKDGDVLSERSLKALQALQNEIESAIRGQENPIDHLTKVRTLINADYLEARGNTLLSRDFLDKGLPATDAEREVVRQQAINDTVYPGLYLSEDSGYGGILIRTDFNAEILVDEEPSPATAGSLDAEEDFAEGVLASSTQTEAITFKKTELPEYKIAVDQLNLILDQDKYTDVFEYYKVGTPVQMAWAYQAMGEEMGVIMVGSLVLVALILFILFRSVSSIVWPMAIVVFSMIYTFGFMGWTGLMATNFTQIIVFLILAVGVADAIHILSGYIYFRGQGEDHPDTLRLVFKKSGVACFLTSLTTSIGLFALAFVPIRPIGEFGVAAGFGVWTAFAITVLVLPVMLELWAPRKKEAPAKAAKPERLQVLLDWMEGVSRRRSTPIMLTFAVLGAVLLFGSTKVQVDSNNIESLKPRVIVRQAVEAVDRVMAGSSNLEIMLDTGVSDGFKDPTIMTRIDAIQAEIKQRYQGVVTKTVSLANIAKNVNKMLNEGRPDYNVIPKDKNALSQVLFLFESSNAKDRRQMITDDYRKGRISLVLKNIGTKEGVKLFNGIETLLNNTFAPLKATYQDLKVTLTGQVPMMTRLSDYVTKSQIQGFGVAFAIIMLLMPLVMGSFTTGLIAMLPNLFPILAGFGVMGFFGIPLEVHTLLVAPIIIGIAVDDTIHFMTDYQMERSHGTCAAEAILNTYREVGQAITFTSIVLSAGFLIFLLSSSQGLAYFGTLSAIAMFTALACDLLLLPAILGRRHTATVTDEQIKGVTP